MHKRKSHRPWLACTCLLAMSVAALPHNVSARPAEGSQTSAIQPLTDATAIAPVNSGPAEPPRPRAKITIGPEAVVADAQAYAIRTQVAGRAMMVTFSSSAPQGQPQPTHPAIYGPSPSGSPVAGIITSRFGPRFHPLSGQWRSHQGVDVAAGEGTPVIATANGLVSNAGWAGGYGLLVSLDHPSGWQTRYGHMSRLNVRPGQAVMAGDVIGFVGSTGRSTGPHLHYEIRRNGHAIDPALD